MTFVYLIPTYVYTRTFDIVMNSVECGVFGVEFEPSDGKTPSPRYVTFSLTLNGEPQFWFGMFL